MAVPHGQAEKYEALAIEAGERLEGESPETILRWASDTFGDNWCITASMADALLIDLASKVHPGLNVIFLDTGYHFDETLQTRDRVEKRYEIQLHTIKPKQSVPEQDVTFGPKLHDRDPDACCSLRKVEPLRRALSDYSAWGSGIRRDETASRANAKVVEWDPKRSMVKINPIAAWTQQQVDEYTMTHDVEVNPLVYDGYPSIGCGPCTRRVLPGEDVRSGRWNRGSKTECGIHLN
jgi:phosphoadenosine phosphosulfate reductase